MFRNSGMSSVVVGHSFAAIASRTGKFRFVLKDLKQPAKNSSIETEYIYLKMGIQFLNFSWPSKTVTMVLNMGYYDLNPLNIHYG